MNDNEEQIVLTPDQQEAYENILEIYPDATVHAIEGSDRVVVSVEEVIWVKKPGEDHKTKKTIDADIYLPPEISKDTPSYSYYNPSGINPSEAKAKPTIDNAIDDALKNDCILCITSPDDYTNLGMETIRAIKGDDGMDNHICIAWSLGGKNIYNDTIARIKENPDLNPQTIVILEAGDNGGQLNTSEENLAILKENGAVIIAYEASCTKGYENSPNYRNIAKYGIPLIIVEVESDPGNSHSDVPAKMFAEDLIGFLNGEIDTIPSALGFYTYDENGNYIELDPEVAIEMMRKNINNSTSDSTKNNEKLFTKEEIEMLFNQYVEENKMYLVNINILLEKIKNWKSEFLSSDAGFLYNNIETIISKINNTRIKDCNVNTNYLSTTASPSMQDVKIMEYISKVNQIICELLKCIEAAMDAQCGITLEDEKLESEASDLPVGNTSNSSVSTTNTNNEKFTSNEKNATSKSYQNSTSVNIATSNAQAQYVGNFQGNSNISNTISSSYTSSSDEIIQENTTQFPEYNSIVSNENTDVFNSLDSNYKIIIHHDNDKLTGVEHYYDFKSRDKAISSLNEVIQNYNINDIKSVDYSNQYVKVTFNDSYYNSSSYHEFISKYDGYDRVTK